MKKIRTREESPDNQGPDNRGSTASMLGCKGSKLHLCFCKCYLFMFLMLYLSSSQKSMNVHTAFSDLHSRHINRGRYQDSHQMLAIHIKNIDFFLYIIIYFFNDPTYFSITSN